ncbi:MAG: N-acetylmuramoyl-L-alanine amidase [Lachnospiraceae bacterium]|nr:N-acetylmuramoyl-L-alanine amidase [Lachnospiraceae bacterium]
MRKVSKVFVLAAMIMLGALFCAQSASAASSGWKTENGYTYYYSKGVMKTGWLKLSGKYYYLRTAEDTDGPEGSRVTGFYTVGDYTYYFSSKGVRQQNGWKKIGGSLYYFKKKSPAGVMLVGRQKIGSYYFYFNASGKMKTGWVTEEDGKHYYRKTGSTGTKGREYTGWHKIGSYYYYFNSSGVMQTDKWISGKYYVDSSGHRLVSTVTPDGYAVNSKGVKTGKAKGWYKVGGVYYYYKSGVKVTGWLKVSGKYYYLDPDTGARQTGWLTVNGNTYYLNSKGVRQTGWTKVNSKRYYFDSNGIMLTNTTVDGVNINENGVATTVRVLLVAGHGQGDVGACATISGTTYYESKLTREFSSLIYDDLTASGADISVTMYNQNYNLYKSMYNLTYYGKTTGPSVTWTDYDYVLEVHFNSGVSNTSGNGSYTGTAMLVHKSKSDVSIDKAIAKAIKNTGFKYWSTGLVRRSDLLNMNLCYKAGVSYGLLETAFVDDKDDMTFYQKNKKKMAQAVADAILASYGLDD